MCRLTLFSCPPILRNNSAQPVTLIFSCVCSTVPFSAWIAFPSCSAATRRSQRKGAPWANISSCLSSFYSLPIKAPILLRFAHVLRLSSATQEFRNNDDHGIEEGNLPPHAPSAGLPIRFALHLIFISLILASAVQSAGENLYPGKLFQFCGSFMAARHRFYKIYFPLFFVLFYLALFCGTGLPGTLQGSLLMCVA